ncbi:HAD family hydrolase [Actinomadura rupiterrae]|uniref:HAD family hydrolase n=1 Tax=Actinomadura rupiterrae TaxID=559627 RepID=UPI0020A52919|nr:HAD family phosphatase [Actinomadura rupiterrae]MCP2339601.1 putative hydrolase of the HAD superfamily [Actinomadura rupiterrae]
MSQTIVFDLYGVIARTQTDAAKKHIEDLAGVAGPPFWTAYWDCRPAYDAGQSSPAYWAAVADRLGTRFADVPALIEADLDSWTDVDDRMVTLVTRLADQGRTLGLLSNIITDLVPRFEAKHHTWLDRFTERVYSCEIGVAKPDPRAYEICATRLGVPPSDILFFDDTPQNITAARKTGMTAHLFTTPTQLTPLLSPTPHTP